MSLHSAVMAIVAHHADEEFVKQVIDRNDGTQPLVIIGSPLDAIYALSTLASPPRYLLIDIGERSDDILPELDKVAEYCEPGTRVVLIGSINDVSFYRELKTRGVTEYFTRPAKVSDIRTMLFYEHAPVRSGKKGDVISFMSAASGDGASTVALNTAYTLATEHNKSVVLVDMDYQFGMIAKNLDLATPFGIKELFDNPDRGIDATLIDRMILSYKNSNLKIIAAPNQLHYIPHVPNELVFNLIDTLRSEYDFVVLDLPHIWTPLVSSALTQSKYTIMVAQLWLRSITHSSRLLSAWRNVGLKNSQISLVANRSGAKFKEAVSSSDFERVCGIPFNCHFVNDTKSVIAAENNGRTLLEGDASDLSRQFRKFASQYTGGIGSKIAESTSGLNLASPKSKLASLFGKS